MIENIILISFFLLLNHLVSANDSSVLKSPPCEVSLDLMFLQDTTQSYEDDFPVLLPQLESLFNSFFKYFPTSKVGIAEFKDKPILPFGWKQDYCYNLKSPLTQNIQQIQNAFADLYASGGDDLAEDQYASIISVVEDPAVGWRSLDLSSEEENRGVKKGRIVVMSTDALPHYDGDAHSVDLPNSYVPHDGHLTHVVNDCTTKRYPVYSQVESVLKGNNIKLATMTPDEDPEVTGTWTWFNDMILGQSQKFNTVLASDSTNFAVAVSDLVNSFAEELCSGSLKSSFKIDSNTLPVLYLNESRVIPPPRDHPHHLKSQNNSSVNSQKKFVYSVRGNGKHSMDIDMNGLENSSRKKSYLKRKNDSNMSGIKIKENDNESL